MGAVGADALLDLERQLARGHHDERPHAAGSGRTAGVQSFQHRQHEGGRLAGARLRARQQVTAVEDERDGLRLDGRRADVALVVHGTERGGRQPEGIEGQGELLTGPSRVHAGPGQGKVVSGWVVRGTGGADRSAPRVSEAPA